MSGNDTITSSSNGKLYKTPSADYKSRNIIYCATCMYCLKQYVGKSNCKLQARVSGHRSHMNDLVFDDQIDDATLAEHLNLVHNLDAVEFFNLGFAFTVLQLSPFDLDVNRVGKQVNIHASFWFK